MEGENGRKSNGVAGESDILEALRTSLDAIVPPPVPPPPEVHPLLKKVEGKDALSYANILRSRNKFPDALVLYDGVLEKDCGNVEAFIGKGICLQMQNMTQQAFQSFLEAIKIDPQNACALTYCGILYKDQGHLLEAVEVKLEGDINQGVEYYNKALYYNWHYADAMYNLGVAYGEMLMFDMAIVFYELALHFNPHCAEACNNLGLIYKDRDNRDKAVECYQMALSIKPNFSQSLNNLGVVYTVQGKIDVAASMIEKAIAANSSYAEAYNNLDKYIFLFSCGWVYSDHIYFVDHCTSSI